MKRYKLTTWDDSDFIIDRPESIKEAYNHEAWQNEPCCLYECEDDGEDMTEWEIIDWNCDMNTGEFNSV